MLLTLPINWEKCDGGAVSTVGSPINGWEKPNLNTTTGGGNKGHFLRGHSVSGEFEQETLA